MTPAQRDLRDFIVDYQNANGGVTPSYQEMADHLGLASKSNTHRLVDALIEQGIVRREPNRARRLEVLTEGYNLTDVSLEALYAEIHRRNALSARAA